MTPPERAIQDAVGLVEQAGAHPLLIDAVKLLKQAQNKVADFVDAHQEHIGWSIELKGANSSRVFLDCNGEWISEYASALRFASRDDAEAYIANAGWTEPFASPNVWPVSY
ncbi:MAG: hypothetical protein KME20_26800 [Kaiparowitsia implicata GSE-PSE-MK54-09C]|nr:hypothetical protein [Kaiparowitsia implicata GSE-PSE-MK54-09C]